MVMLFVFLIRDKNGRVRAHVSILFKKNSGISVADVQREVESGVSQDDTFDGIRVSVSFVG